MPRVNATVSIAHQAPQQHYRADSHAHSAQTATEVLSNGQQIHKIPYHLPNSPIQSTSQKFFVDSAAPDGMLPHQRLSVSKTGKKYFTTGKNSVTAVPTRAGKTNEHDSWTAPTLPAVPLLSCDILDELKEHVYHHRNKQPLDLDFVVDYDANRCFRPAKPFVNRSLFYTLSDSETLLKSFHDNSEAFKNSPLPHLDSVRLTNSFRDWNSRNGALIFDSLCIAVEALFTPPPELSVQKSPRLRPSKDSFAEQSSDRQKSTILTPRYLTGHEAAHIVMLCIHALTSLVSVGWTHTWAQLRKLRSWGVVVPSAASHTDALAHPYLNLIDELEYEPAVRLADRLLRGIGARTCFEHILASLNQKNKRRLDAKHSSADTTLVDIIVQHLKVVECVALTSKRRPKSSHSLREDPGWTVTATFLEWLRTIIIKNWDSKATINKWSNVGTAVMLLDKLRK